MNRWFGKYAFRVHAVITSILWIATFILIVIFQFEKQIIFHDSVIIRYIGLFLIIVGAFIAGDTFRIMGFKRTLCINFYRDSFDLVRTSFYKYLDNPMDYGFWLVLTGFALFTASLYNLIIAGEFILVMIPHILIENIPVNLKKQS